MKNVRQRKPGHGAHLSKEASFELRVAENSYENEPTRDKLTSLRQIRDDLDICPSRT